MGTQRHYRCPQYEEVPMGSWNIGRRVKNDSTVACQRRPILAGVPPPLFNESDDDDEGDS
jgi:hypothetical protein